MKLQIENARLWDGIGDCYLDASSLLLVDGRIAGVDVAADAQTPRLDAAGQAVLPGLIDAHFHAYAADVNVPFVESLPLSYLAHYAARSMAAALARGFTTVRDAGGADWGLWRALEDGLISGPRLFYSGRALSQTGGHGDSLPIHAEPCGCSRIANLSQVIDGVDGVRAAAREIFRQGAHQLKIFVSGGISSPTDPIWMRQFSAEEIAAAVQEAGHRRTYVMAHAYGADAIVRAVENGVRSIEHGNLLDESAARLMAEHDAFLVPTLVTYEALADAGPAQGLSEESCKKLKEVIGFGSQAIRIARNAGVRIGFGTDLLGPLQHRQMEEFRLRQQGESTLEVLRSATSDNAALLMQDGELGVIATGARADLILVDGDPLTDLRCLYERGPSQVIQGGRVVSKRPRR